MFDCPVASRSGPLHGTAWCAAGVARRERSNAHARRDLPGRLQLRRDAGNIEVSGAQTRVTVQHPNPSSDNGRTRVLRFRLHDACPSASLYNILGTAGTPTGRRASRTRSSATRTSTRRSSESSKRRSRSSGSSFSRGGAGAGAGEAGGTTLRRQCYR